MPDQGVIGGDGQVARHLQFIPAAHRHAVDPRDGGFPDVAQPLERFDEDPHPLVKIAGAGEEIVLPFPDVGAGAERLRPGAGHDDDRDVVVPGGVLKGPPQLAEGFKVQRVVDRRTVDGDRHPVSRLLIEDVPEAEGGGLFPCVFCHYCTSPEIRVMMSGANASMSRAAATPSGEAFAASIASSEG